MTIKSRRWPLLLSVLLAGVMAYAQDPTAKPGASASQQAPAAGGPQGEVGPYAVPKKPEEPPSARTAPPKNPPEIGDFSITRDVALVNVPVLVTTLEGQPVPGLKAENFRLYEDGAPQKISNFNTAQAPITAVLLLEFADIYRPFLSNTLAAAYSFTETLKPEDWVAVAFYDIKPHILADFTQDKRQAQSALKLLRTPGFAETNVYDALADTLDRLEGIAGRKYIILIGTGEDTFSWLRYDETYKRIKGAKDITIFAISPVVGAGVTQTSNLITSLVQLTGGRYYSVSYEADLLGISHEIDASIRMQYVLSFHPTNPKLDGTYRKLKVELVDARTGGPLKLLDEKGKPVRYSVSSREGYTAKHEVE